MGRGRNDPSPGDRTGRHIWHPVTLTNI
ncbi:hypothetical protein SGPA1_20839 [Streptomyces misionensis JCM 4497]